jgi:hypothetical protein
MQAVLIGICKVKTMIRGGRIFPWIVKPEGDASWSRTDWSRARTLEARLNSMGISEEERRSLIPCAVWKAKFPGLTYTDSIETRLAQVLP